MVEIVNDIIAQLRTIPELQHVQIWNNQFALLEEGAEFAFPFPCAFAEFNFLDGFGQLGSNYQGSDVEVKIHLGNDFYNGAQFDDNFNIFTLRDLVVKSMAGFKPTGTGNLFKIQEEQDFDHSNVYHYTLTYKAHFIDSTAAQTETYTTPPTQWQPTITENE